MKHACRYAIVRFIPYAETGEFANVGIVLLCPTAKYFGYRMIERVARVTAFFEELDVHVFRKARKNYADELMRIAQSVERCFVGASNGPGPEFANFVFSELVKPRQAVIYADTDRVVLAEDPSEKLVELFDHYVGRSFATKAYQERSVEKQVHQILRAADLTSLYQRHTLGGTDAYKALIPFVRVDERGRAVRAIKPLFLAHDDPTRLYDHGWDWLGKVKKLRRDGTLEGDVLFAVQRPSEDFGPRASAFSEVTHELGGDGITVLPADEKERILEFARSS